MPSVSPNDLVVYANGVDRRPNLSAVRSQVEASWRRTMRLPAREIEEIRDRSRLALISQHQRQSLPPEDR